MIYNNSIFPHYTTYLTKVKIIEKKFNEEYILTANSFVEWFLKNKPQHIEIPYIKQNQKNKLKQLAQANNREFKKLLHAKVLFS